MAPERPSAIRTPSGLAGPVNYRRKTVCACCAWLPVPQTGFTCPPGRVTARDRYTCPPDRILLYFAFADPDERTNEEVKMQARIRTVIMRGGTRRGIFLRDDDLPV